MLESCKRSSHIRVGSPCIVLVEGREEELLFTALCRKAGIPDIQFESFGGKDKLTQTLRALLKESGFLENARALGVIRDADQNPRGAFDSVCSSLRSAGLPCPDSECTVCLADGLYGKPSLRIGVAVLPGNSESGTLEDLCLRAVSQSAAFRCVSDYINCLEDVGVNHTGSALSKAKIHVFLASLDEPDRRLGEAAEKYLPLSHEAFEPVRKFLKGLNSDA